MARELLRKRRKAAIIAAVAILLLAGAAAILLFTGPRLPPRSAPWYDYSEMLQILPGAATLRYPTAKELKAFPVLWPAVPVEENAALHYAKAIRLAKKKGIPPGSLSSVDTYAGDLAALEAWVAANRPLLDMAREAQGHAVCRLPVFVSIATNDFPEPCRELFMPMRSLARSFGDDGLAEELAGRPQAAVEPYLACMRMGAQLRKGIVIHSLVGLVIVPIGAGNLERLVANTALPEDDLKKIIRASAEAETRPGEIADSTECEAEWDAANLSSAGFRARTIGEIAGWYSGNSQAIETARKDAERPIYEIINNPAAQLALDHKPGGEVNKSLVLWQWRVDLAKSDTKLRALQIRSAIALYQRAHGKLPETLDALCPEFLPEVPLDPFSGKPLRYRVAGEDWVVWSVGPDLKNDGGTDEIGRRLAKQGLNWGKDVTFVSGVKSAIAQIQRRTVLTMDLKAQEQELAALAAEQAAHPEIDELGLSALHRAANRGDLAEVEALLAKGADVNARGLAKQTPLHLAVTKEIAQALISKGAQIEARDKWGRTPLFWAAGAGRKGVVEALLAAGAQADAPEMTDVDLNRFNSELRSQLPAKMRSAMPPTDESPRTPITYAAEQGCDDIAEMLRKHLAEHPAKK